MDSNASSIDEHNPVSVEYLPTTFARSAPSDWLPHLSSSSEPAFAAEAEDTSPTAEKHNGTGLPTKPQIDAYGRTLNPRSCVTCRKRKVKCDRVHPCSNCNRGHIECVYPAPGRAPRKVRKTGDGRDKELLERLRRLEGVVKGLGVDVSEHDDDEDTRKQSQGGPLDGDIGQDVQRTPASSNDAEQDWAYKYFEGREQPERTRWMEERHKGMLENRFGRLVINEGKSRYINNSFWANLSNEVEDLKGILNESSEDEDIVEAESFTLKAAGDQQGWIFGFSSQSVDLLALHPVPGLIRAYWEVYKDRVDPLVKVLHIPTTEPTVLRAASHLSNLSKGFEALLFMIYYAATTSVSGSDCVAMFGEEKSVLLARYRFGIEQALARANFLVTEETVVLQAFVIFLICLRRNNDARVIWTLTGLVVRIAQTLGVHRDGSHFGLTPFEIEMRRRLWWQVCILDIRASEDHGCDPTITEESFDTKMPLNVNDVDISPNMKDFPEERQGCTDMSFCLLRFEVANTFRRINYVPPAPPRACDVHLFRVTLQDKEKWITNCHNRLEERYLKHCDMSVPLYWVTATVARLMMSKMWLMVYHPFQRQDGGRSLPNETKEKLFITSLENIEYSILLETEARTMKWGWLFKTYMQWHALAFILSELCHRSTGELVERAWVAVEKSKDGRWGVRFTEDSQADHLWRPLKKLYGKAKEARARGLQEEARTKPQAPQRTYTPNANPMFEHPPRPHLTRAPLSQAQLQRFTSGPSFGEVPVDKHELFRSPKITETAVQDEIDTMDAISLQNGTSRPQLGRDSMMNDQGVNMNGVYSVYNSFPTEIRQGNPQYDPNFIASGPSDILMNNNSFGYANAQNPQNFMPSNALPHGAPARMSSVDSNGIQLSELDMSVMDTSGDLDWESWDQLVKQFGMDVDSNPNPGTATDWAGGGWDTRTMQGNLF